MEDTFSLPLPPGGFLETQLQETPGDFDEEQDEDSSAEETQKPFPELVKMFLSQGYNNNEVCIVLSGSFGSYLICDSLDPNGSLLDVRAPPSHCRSP